MVGCLISNEKMFVCQWEKVRAKTARTLETKNKWAETAQSQYTQ
jgi:hypothetical protein